MKRTGLTTYWLATLALASLLWAAPAGAQSQNSANPQDRDDLTRQQLTRFDQFLDDHPDLAGQIRNNPSLVNNEEFVESHSELQQYLQQHPEVREDLRQNPNAVMQEEQRYERREDVNSDRNRDRDNDHDITRLEMSNMNSFLDNHPEIAEQLRKNPSLIDNKDFLAAHPALQQFVASHPAIREEVRENPNAFMSAEFRYEHRADSHEMSEMESFMNQHPEIAEQLRKNPSLVNNKKFVASHPALQQMLAEDMNLRASFQENPNQFMQEEQRFADRGETGMRGVSSNPDVTRGELATMDRFMDGHPEIAQQLHKNPQLVDNKEFVSSHPALQQFLASNPNAREELKENPNAFMQQEQRFDRHEYAAGRGDQDATHGQLASFHEFLEGHSAISSELSKNPSLATNQEYLENHTALKTYLKANPQVGEELNQNPQAFMKSAQTFDANSNAAVKGTMKLPAEPKK